MFTSQLNNRVLVSRLILRRYKYYLKLNHSLLKQPKYYLNTWPLLAKKKKTQVLFETQSLLAKNLSIVWTSVTPS